jgi:hypothetical protein
METAAETYATTLADASGTGPVGVKMKPERPASAALQGG